MKMVPDDAKAREGFDSLSPAEQAQAIFRLADAGHGDYTIAAATKLSVEYIRLMLAERRAAIEASE